MFIGASPSSTGGGIRCTTLFIIFLTMFSRLIGRNEVRIFKRRISEKTIHDSFFIIFIAFALILFCAVLLYYCHPLVNENQSAYNVQQCLFEVSSAFGTVGFSVGVTAIMNNVGLVILCIVMFIGQIGISAAILS
jgi:Trk-type K+ transport system membrane component